MPIENKFAIRFGLGAIKAVGFNMMEGAIKERQQNDKFEDVYDFAQRMGPKTINKKSIEALAKAGAFDLLNKNRRQIAESFDILSSYATKKKEAALSNQMNLFDGMAEANRRPELRKTEDWNKAERLQKEFEAFGFFLNEHPLDDNFSDLKKRGVIFSDKIERDELEDNNLVKMAGVVAASKHRSGSRGRFAYLTISDPFGIFEAMVFDEALITAARDILVDGSAIALECLIRKDDGGVRILVREVKKLDDFIKTTKAQEKDFEDIKKQPNRNRNYYDNSPRKSHDLKGHKPERQEVYSSPSLPVKKIVSAVEIILKSNEAILNVKIFLSQRLAPLGSEKFTKVFFTVIDKNKIAKIELPKSYFLDEADVTRLKAINVVSDIEIIS